MNNPIDQIQLDYVADEDRLLLKLRAGKQLYRVWLTRRFVRILIPMLMGVRPDTGERFAEIPALPPETDAQLEPEVAPPLEQHAGTEDMVLEYPLGETPLLLTEITYLPPSAKDAYAQLALKPARGEGILLPHSVEMAHILLKLLHHTLSLTDWSAPLWPEAMAPEGNARLQ